MRGTIQVLPSQDQAGNVNPAGTAKPPLYVILGLDIDAPHLADVTPETKPSAAGGESLVEKAPADYDGYPIADLRRYVGQTVTVAEVRLDGEHLASITAEARLITGNGEHVWVNLGTVAEMTDTCL